MIRYIVLFHFIPLLSLSSTLMAENGLAPPLNAIDNKLCNMEKAYYSGKVTHNDAIYDGLLRLRESTSKVPFSSLKCHPSEPGRQDRICHEYFMGSLKKAESRQEVETFVTRVSLENQCILQPKIDGVAVELVYTHGQLTSASTRGDGQYGRNILNIISLSPSIPSRLYHAKNHWSEPKVILHGELYFIRKKKEGQTNPFYRDRHRLAGLISQKKPDMALLEEIGFFPWLWVNSPNHDLWSDIRQLSSWGFANIGNYSVPVSTMDDISRWYHHYRTQSSSSPMLTDGVVIRSTEKESFRLSPAHRYPRLALAWKFPPEYAVVRIDDILWQKGKKGRETAVLSFRPVCIQGITISRVSGGGIRNVRKNNISKGDIVSIAFKGHSTPVLDGLLVKAK